MQARSIHVPSIVIGVLAATVVLMSMGQSSPVLRPVQGVATDPRAYVGKSKFNDDVGLFLSDVDGKPVGQFSVDRHGVPSFEMNTTDGDARVQITLSSETGNRPVVALYGQTHDGGAPMLTLSLLPTKSGTETRPAVRMVDSEGRVVFEQ